MEIRKVNDNSYKLVDTNNENIICNLYDAIRKIMCEDVVPHLSIDNCGVGEYEYGGAKGFDDGGGDFVLVEKCDTGPTFLYVDITEIKDKIALIEKITNFKITEVFELDSCEGEGAVDINVSLKVNHGVKYQGFNCEMKKYINYTMILTLDWCNS